MDPGNDTRVIWGGLVTQSVYHSSLTGDTLNPVRASPPGKTTCCGSLVTGGVAGGECLYHTCLVAR